MATSKPPLFSSRPSAHARPGDAFGGSRVYDYTMKYPPDQLGEEHKENARVWNIYLDEAENHDRDMLQGFREIIDGVLIFVRSPIQFVGSIASLFSAVVTTLVAQTSQALQPDNAQIMVSLLVENNQLLRATGNSTTINDVPKSTLSPGSVIYTSMDVWAYSSFITGDAQRRAFVTHFRAEGLRTWRMRQIVEALPLILHGSVLVFFVGLVLYVSQLSTPICGILASITALSFAFYVGSSFLPAVFIACPYRIPVLFDVGQSFIIFIHSIGVAVLSLVILARGFVPSQLWSLCEWKLAKWKSKIHQRPLEIEEIDAIFSQSHIAFNVLQQLLQTTSQRTTQQVVLEAVFALLLEFEKPEERRSVPLEIQQPFEHPLATLVKAPKPGKTG
ncbi:hypothetical protein H0H93_003798 [Arthromyces matolae]|nr:hypothetical protein H0H93_003798 [Arthromyces matolae]